MKKLLIASICLVALKANAQMKDPVNWKYEAHKTANGQYAVTLTATVEKPWHIYSQNTGKGGPIPTEVVFKTNPLVEKEGVVKENGRLQKVYDKNFKTDVLFYSGTVSFVQTVKLKSSAKTSISGTVEYMVCDDEQCLPPTKKTFDIRLM
jgi:DsbC/DsbD-like thiol-disulfide interchange protein